MLALIITVLFVDNLIEPFSPTAMFNQSIGPNMKFTFLRNAFFGIALTLEFSLSATQAQIPGQTQGIGGGSSQGVGGAATTRLPGSFGGPGITGVSQVEYSNTNALKGFTTATAGSAGGTGGATSGIGGATGGATSNATGGLNAAGGAFGVNAFGSGVNTGLGGGGLGGLGGLGGGGLGGFGGGGLGGVGGLGGLGGNRSRTGTGTGTAGQSKNKVRAVAKPDIELASPRTSQSIGASLETRMTKLPLPAKLRNVTVKFEGDVVVLRGQVATESDKKMIERLVKLEPGVNSVLNEVKVLSKPLERIQASPIR